MTKIARAVGGVLLMFLVAPQLATAQGDLFAGTWKANVAKSSYSPDSSPKSETMTVEAVGSGFKISLDGVNQQGRYHSDSTGTFGGGDAPVLATPPRQARFAYALRRVDGRTWEILIKVDGAPRILVHNVVSNDGKTTTSVSTTVGTPAPRTIQTVIYEKQ